MTPDPAPNRVALTGPANLPGPEWVKWFDQLRQAFAAADAAAASTATTTDLSAFQAALTAAQTAIQALESEVATIFQTNGQNNGNQQQLNIIAGTNITVSEDSNGNVTISSTASSSTPTTTPYEEAPSGVKNGTNTVFTLSFTPAATDIPKIFRNGILQDVRWTSVSGNTVTCARPPQPADQLWATYRY